MIAVNLDNSLSYFNKVHNVLSKYQLPTLNELRIKQPTKESWRSTVKEAVNKYWTESLKNEAYEKSSLRYLNIDFMKNGRDIFCLEVFGFNSVCCKKRNYKMQDVNRNLYASKY